MPVKQTAQQIAKQVARNTFEESEKFLKSAREQIYPVQRAPEREQREEKPREEPTPPKTNRLLQSYNTELEEIRRDNLFKDLQIKIANGEDVPLENYQNELSSEQREVLKAQIEAIHARKVAEESRQNESLPQIVSKRARGMMNTFKKRNQQHVEMRQPPSG
ncbi:MAG TPA: hypothetical protein VLE44_02815 [Candidatus Saccharimonadales bacterium]|nr:hypothetical protein [Candidatus Saccharimonadales bacterium]